MSYICCNKKQHQKGGLYFKFNTANLAFGSVINRQELDTAIEQCYRLQPFKNDTERLEYLFKQYEEMLHKDTLFAKQKKRRK